MTTEQTNQSIELVTNKLDSYLAILAEKLGVAADYVYPLFVKQQAIEAWTSIGFLTIGFGFGLILFKRGFKDGTKYKWEDSDAIKFAPNIIIGGIMLLVSFIFTCNNANSITTKLLNPEYAAIQAIIQSVK